LKYLVESLQRPWLWVESVDTVDARDGVGDEESRLKALLLFTLSI
jgi:hypothetical protein